MMKHWKVEGSIFGYDEILLMGPSGDRRHYISISPFKGQISFQVSVGEHTFFDIYMTYDDAVETLVEAIQWIRVMQREVNHEVLE
jgi:hypothetical protein